MYDVYATRPLCQRTGRYPPSIIMFARKPPNVTQMHFMLSRKGLDIFSYMWPLQTYNKKFFYVVISGQLFPLFIQLHNRGSLYMKNYDAENRVLSWQDGWSIWFRCWSGSVKAVGTKIGSHLSLYTAVQKLSYLLVSSGVGANGLSRTACSLLRFCFSARPHHAAWRRKL